MEISAWTKSFKSIWGAGVLIATAGPLGLLVPDLYPPWPDHSYVIGVTFAAVAAIISMTAGLAYAHQARASAKGHTVFALACLALGLISLVWYFLVYSTRVVVETQMVGGEQHELRFVVGTETRDDVDKTETDYLDLLRENQYSPERVWTSKSLRSSRFLLLITFVAAFFLLTLGMGLLATRTASSRVEPPRNRGN